MENDLLVHEFLDGTLSAAEEEKLFSLLAGENELRSELKQQLAIKGAIRADVKAFSPKADSTLQIFDKLGLAVPLVPVPVATPVTGFGSRLSAFLTANSGYILSGVVSAIATVAVMLMLFDFGSSEGTANQLSNNSHNNYTINPENSNENISELSNKIDDSDSKNTQIPEKIVYKYIYVNNVPENESQNSNIEPSDNELYDGTNNLTNSSISNSAINTNNLVFNNGFFGNQKSSANFPLSENMYFGSNLNTGNFKLELRGSDYMSKQYQGVNTNDNFNLMNTGLTFLYKFNNELSFGLDYRRESFSQEFTGKENDNYFLYRQEPNFQTFSLVAKYNPVFLSWDRLSPFVYLGLGANSSGPVGRVMLGTDLYLTGNYYLTFGADYNTLLYSQSGAYFFSPKLGFHFGGGVNF